MARPTAQQMAIRFRMRDSGREERQVDLLRDLQKGRIDYQEYRELGGTAR